MNAAQMSGKGATAKPAPFDTVGALVKQITNNTQSEQVTTLAVTPTAPLVRAAVVGRYFDVSTRTVALWAKNGTIPCVWLGGALRFNMEAVLRAAR